MQKQRKNFLSLLWEKTEYVRCRISYVIVYTDKLINFFVLLACSQFLSLHISFFPQFNDKVIEMFFLFFCIICFFFFIITNIYFFAIFLYNLPIITHGSTLCKQIQQWKDMKNKIRHYILEVDQNVHIVKKSRFGTMQLFHQSTDCFVTQKMQKIVKLIDYQLFP